MTLEVKSWDNAWTTRPRAILRPQTIEDVVAAMKDPVNYPAPVRPHGTGHSPADCRGADGGTVVDMLGMNRILEIGADTITVEAGALYIDTAKELERHGLQHYVNTEIGCLTVGSGACCATKDASMPGEHGQLSAYVIGMKIVTAAGDVVSITEDDPELLQVARSSYGLLGIVCEVTFRVRPLQRLAVRHETYSFDDLVARLPELVARDTSLMLYFFPFLDRVTVEFRHYIGPAAGRSNRIAWRLRNVTWRTISPAVTQIAELIPSRRIRNALLDRFNSVVHVMVDKAITSKNTRPPDQMIRYPHKAGWTAFTSSIWAFPDETFRTALPEYREFVRAYDREHHWRPNMLAVGYRVDHDQSSLLSYSWDGPALTIDPVSTLKPGWYEFLDAFNQFCIERGGSPLINQTPGLTRQHVEQAFGDRLGLLESYRRRFDPEDRLLSDYFRELLPTSNARR